MKFLKKLFAPSEVRAARRVIDEIKYELVSQYPSCEILFRTIRQVIETTILEQPQKFASVIANQGMNPLIKVLSMIEHVAGDYLKSGDREFFIYKGTLNYRGEDLLRLYDYNIDQMVKHGGATEAEAQKQKSDIRNHIKEVG